ncbi:mitofusin-1-like [Montipora foliosa]|uniref:mitofusin-1-like n=1 Tax=Montipora foliosa TaxID=591990 RepID=UPI0035F14576
MATGKSKTIHEIDDIAEMFQAMMALDISCKGLKTLDQMKAKVKEDLHQSEREASWTAGQAFSILSEAKDEDSRKRHILTDLYNDTETCLEKMDEKILKLLQQKESNVEEKMKNHKLQLARKEYFLLVAGETSSGKSSLINLILGDELLPHSVLSTTSTICELKFGNERKIVAHFKDKDPETGLATKVIRLHKTDPGEASDEQSYLQQISPFVHVKNDREKGSIYKKIELFWPHSLLQRGIVIIDSPSVGESDLMDEIVTQYLPQAFAFIYTINSANAGGVQKDRLEKLLENVQNLFREGTDQFPSKCALFVCNKWDQVPEKEAKEVKNHVVRNLKRCWPGLDPEKQVIYISTMNATKGQNLGIITEEFSYMMEGIKSMVLKSIECRLEIHWRWLENLLSRIIFQAKAYVSNTFKDRRKVLLKITKIIQRLVVIESQQNEVIADLKEYLNERVNIAVKQLSEHLSTEEVRKRFTSWTLDDVPKAKDSWESTENQIERVLSGRLREFIEQWEEDKGVFSNARESLLKHFQRRYDFVEEQLRNLQSEVIADNTGDPQTCSSDFSFTATEKVAIGVLSPIWVPLGLVALLIGAPIVGIAVIREKIVDKRKLKKYEADKCAFMTKLSEEYLSLANTWIALQRFVKEQLEDAYLCLKQIKARIPELIRADKMLCEELSEETREPILFKATEIRGNLDLFGFEEVFGFDISSNELD